MKRALTIAHAVALALGAAHDCHSIHRDVKPLNIMLGHNGAIKLIDFGIARSYQEEQEREDAGTDIVVGTPQYLAPEQAQCFPLSPATDVYALDTETSLHSALPIGAFMCGFIVLIALMSIYLTLHLYVYHIHLEVKS